MKLSEVLECDLIHLNIECASKDELISKLLDQVYNAGKAPPFPPAEVMSKIKIREGIGGTLLPSGLSVPHARLKGYEGFIVALGTSSKPLFHDGIQIRLMALMISSQSGGPLYLPSLAAFTKLSRDGQYFSRLCGAESPERLFSIVLERDPELG